MAKSLRVAFLIVDLDRGGAQRLLTWIAPRLAARGGVVEVITLKDTTPLAGSLESAGIAVRRLGMRGAWDVRAIPRLVAALRAFRPHVLHTQLFHANVLGRLCGRLAGVPHIRSTFQTLEGPSWHRALDRLTAPLADSHEFVSKAVARRWGRRGEIVHYGVPRGSDPSTPAGPPFIVTAARLVPGKGIDDLIAALPREAGLRILGDGPDEGRLRRLAEPLGGRVVFGGWTEDMKAGLRGATIAAFASRLGEGSPVAVQEAMMAGIPVVATDVGGTPELIEDGVTGWLVPPGRRDLLAERLEWILRHPAAARAVAERGRAAALEKFDVERTAAHLDRVYRAAVSPCSDRAVR
ncbi:MAG TPA: glycosyltransferase [Planctomycetota bacterium]|jgi:glycosyltransferase involved in cell wall biosynthesis